MAAGIPRKVKVHYRRAVLEGGDEVFGVRYRSLPVAGGQMNLAYDGETLHAG
jgi:hypothetical protein